MPIHSNYQILAFRCQNCGQQFLENLTRQLVDEARHNLIDTLRLEQMVYPYFALLIMMMLPSSSYTKSCSQSNH